MHPDDEIDWPKRIPKDQRLYVCRPEGRDWREALMNYHAVQRGETPRKLWDVLGNDPWRADDLLITYMQTSPMMVVHIDQFSPDCTQTIEIEHYRLCHFVNGVSLDLVNQRLGFKIQDVDLYWEAPEARLIVNAVKHEYKRASTVFGDNRLAEAINMQSQRPTS